MKTFIIGCSGSGKSTLAKQLGDNQNRPVYYGDDIFTKDYTIFTGMIDPTNEEIQEALIKFIDTLPKNCIVEGVVLFILMDYIKDKDVIVVKTNPFLSSLRAVKRNTLLGLCTLPHLLTNIWRFYTANREYMRELKTHGLI